jgi:hypothetical protein
MMHTNYQPARKGLYAMQIEAARALREAATKKAMADLPAAYHNNPNLRMIPVGAYKSLEMHRVIAEHREWALANHCSKVTRNHLRYSDQGDFTRCYRGGF